MKGKKKTNSLIIFTPHPIKISISCLNILKKYGYDLSDILNTYKEKQRPDILDAASLAVTAFLGLEYGFRTIPPVPVKDSTGLLMQMVFADI